MFHILLHTTKLLVMKNKGVHVFITWISILLMIQTISGEGNKTICYDDLGCFSLDAPWTTLERPVPPPSDPKKVDTQLYCYTREDRQRHNITMGTNISLDGCPFNASRITVCIAHGFLENGSTSEWMDEMKDNYLCMVDANVFIMNWAGGAVKLNYLQAASNTRTAAAVVVKCLKCLIDQYGLDPKLLHLIGFSLGAHVVAYISNGLPSPAKKITGLDPAQPAFDCDSTEVRLDRTDADFVEVMHTSAASFFLCLGFGYLAPCGHADYYFNGGNNQPGCPISTKTLTSDILTKESFIDVFSNEIICNHARSYMVYNSALKGECTFVGHKTTYSPIEGVVECFNTFPIIVTKKSDSDCTSGTCNLIGLNISYTLPGVFGVSTTSSSPYCETGTSNLMSSIHSKITSLI